MKKLISSIIIILAFITVIQAQEKIPADPSVIKGTLPNGLTYYIRHNAKPEKRAFFYIAQKVGSIQEEPEQRGLAHFLEHMCFNGTTHFPGNSMTRYLGSIGVKFGENVNAYTSIDETVYNIDNVPVTVTGAIDSCLTILHDWSHSLTLSTKEIDKERGVINEEWRMRNDANQRLMETMMPVLMAGSKYADCMPIGTMDVVMHFKPETLRKYYEKWYRPDLQGIVIVGDFDVHEMETRVKRIFSDIPAVKNGAERVCYPVPDNKTPIIFIGKDKEMTAAGSVFYFKHDAPSRQFMETMDYMREDFLHDIVLQMLNMRFAEMMQQPGTPFIGASVDNGAYFVSKTKDAFTASVGCRESDISGGIEAMLREVFRVKQNGFTATEYERAKADYTLNVENVYNERANQKSKNFVNVCVRNFLDNNPMASIEQNVEIYRKLVPSVTLQEVNEMANRLISDSNVVMTLTVPDKQGLNIPTETELQDIYNKVKAEKLEQYQDKTDNEPLIKIQPLPGRIVKEKTNDKMGTTEMTLSNGARVIIKRTDFKADQIDMKAVSRGGSSLLSDSIIVDIKNLGVANVGGVSSFSVPTLQKKLAGKSVSAVANISLTKESVNANCTPKDIKTMMQLVYLTFTSPRKDLNAFTSYKRRLKESLHNAEMNPQTAFTDSASRALYGNSPRVTRMKENMVEKINYNRVLDIYRQRFSNASDFTFFFVGNVDVDSLRPYLEQYIAALPSTGSKETEKKMMYLQKGVITKEFLKRQETPESTVLEVFSGKEKLTQRNSIIADMLGQILQMVYTRTIREDASAAYSVGCQCSLEDYPEPTTELQISFTTAPEKKPLAMKLVVDGIKGIAEKGPEAADLQKVIEYKLKKHAEMIKENSYWMNILEEQWLSDIDYSKDYNQIVNSITASDIRQFAARLQRQGNYVSVVMTSK